MSETRIYYWFRVGNGNDILTFYKDEYESEALRAELVSKTHYDSLLAQAKKMRETLEKITTHQNHDSYDTLEDVRGYSYGAIADFDEWIKGVE